MLEIDTYRTPRKRPPSRFFPLEAEELMQNGQVENATELCKRGLVYFPENISGYAVLAQAYAQLGQQERAINVLEHGYRRTGAEGLQTLRKIVTGEIPPFAQEKPDDETTKESPASRGDADAAIAQPVVEQVESEEQAAPLPIAQPEQAATKPIPQQVESNQDAPENPADEVATAEPLEIPAQSPVESADEVATAEPLEIPAQSPVESADEQAQDTPEDPADEVATAEPLEIPAQSPVESADEQAQDTPEDPADEVATAEPLEIPAQSPVESADEQAQDTPEDPADEAATAEPLEIPAQSPVEFTDEQAQNTPEDPADEVATAEPLETPAQSPVEPADEVATAEPLETPAQSPVESADEVATAEPLETPAQSPVESADEVATAEPLETPVQSPVESADEVATAEPLETPVQSPVESADEHETVAENSPQAIEPEAVQPEAEEQREPVVRKPEKSEAGEPPLRHHRPFLEPKKKGHHKSEAKPLGKAGHSVQPGHGVLSLHSGTKISRLSSSNLRLIPGLEFAPLRRDDDLKLRIAPLVNEPPPSFNLSFDPIIPGLPSTLSRTTDGSAESANPAGSPPTPADEAEEQVVPEVSKEGQAVQEVEDRTATPDQIPAETVETAPNPEKKEEPNARRDAQEIPQVSRASEAAFEMRGPEQAGEITKEETRQEEPTDLFPEVPESLPDEDFDLFLSDFDPEFAPEPISLRPEPGAHYNGMTPLEELARRLETARIPIVEEEEESYDNPAFEPSIVSDTFAAILAGQGAYTEAIKAYQMLARLKPERRQEYERKIAEMRWKMSSV